VSRAALLSQVRGAITGGIDVVYLREPELPARALVRLVRGVVDLCRGRGVRVLVGDRLDVALVCGADGVQLPERGLPSAVVRRFVGEGFLVGR
jgi:thiamine-phosphate pyrophosphorylase